MHVTDALRATADDLAGESRGDQTPSSFGKCDAQTEGVPTLAIRRVGQRWQFVTVGQGVSRSVGGTKYPDQPFCKRLTVCPLVSECRHIPAIPMASGTRGRFAPGAGWHAVARQGEQLPLRVPCPGDLRCPPSTRHTSEGVRTRRTGGLTGRAMRRCRRPY